VNMGTVICISIRAGFMCSCCVLITHQGAVKHAPLFISTCLLH
jgi:hypothetical protein